MVSHLALVSRLFSTRSYTVFSLRSYDTPQIRSLSIVSTTIVDYVGGISYHHFRTVHARYTGTGTSPKSLFALPTNAVLQVMQI